MMINTALNASAQEIAQDLLLNRKFHKAELARYLDTSIRKLNDFLYNPKALENKSYIKLLKTKDNN